MLEINTVEAEVQREMEEAQAVEGEGSGPPVRENASQENSGEPNNVVIGALYQTMQTLNQITDTFTGMAGRLSELEQAVGIVARLSQFSTDFGRPGELLTCDNALEFTGRDLEIRTWADQNGVDLHTTPFHPQSNGMIERMHRTMKGVLAQLCKGYPVMKPAKPPGCQTHMNMAVHGSTGVTSGVAFFSRHRRPPRSLVEDQTKRKDWG